MNDDIISRSALNESIRKRLCISSLEYLTEQEKVIVDEINNAQPVEPPAWQIEFLKRLYEKVRPTSDWIPISERLPEEDGQYLITVKYVHVDGYDDIYAEHGEWVNGKWDMFMFGHCGEVESIIAWMPLPEPYKENQQ